MAKKKVFEQNLLEYPDLEAILLSGIMNNPGSFPQVADTLNEKSFSRPLHSAIWSACGYLYKKGTPIDPVMVSGHLITTGFVNLESGQVQHVLPEVEEISKRAISSNVAIVDYAKKIKGYAALRDLISICHRTIEEAHETDSPDDVRSSLMARLSHVKTATTDNIYSLADIGVIFKARLQEDDAIAKSRVMSTGYTALDRMLGGIPEGTINVFVAYQKVGKSTLTTQAMLREAEREKHAGIIFSLEMDKELVYQRLVQIKTGLPMKEIMQKQVKPTPEQSRLIDSTMEYLKTLPLSIVDKECNTVASIRAHVHQFMANNPNVELKTILVDHFHLISRGKYDDMKGMSVNAEELMSLTKETGVRILLPAQLRDPQQNMRGPKSKDPSLPMPGLHDIRYAKDLIDACYNLIAIHRPNMHKRDGDLPEVCQVRLLASRDSSFSGYGVEDLYYVHGRGAFYEIDHDSYWQLNKLPEYDKRFFTPSDFKK